MNFQLFAAFVLITTILILTPGPIVTLIISTGASQGIRAALATAAGTTLGNAILLSAIAFGLSWVLANAVVLFEALRWTGALYLVYLGVSAWRNAKTATEQPAPPKHHVHFARGLLVALTNPKTIVFFTAFLPQFVDPTLPAGPQLGLMCAVSVLFAGLSDSAYAVASGYGRAWFQKPGRTKWLGRASGSVLIAGGIWLSFTRRPTL
ncbi:threonine/homoserine/homoserine lactone efflux protein [Roseiarcus fermentans]|uniref:Threonine/homoserine/homoserine lactone efflux protein n=1 Tax=Roseiarcus fermentans TaxID=1473586 RepID=A0A366FCJ3_9HYPH|nr:LysE family translocator [Roseiarcus fermentans]RBP11425.1 threonine/homoserine/homoserine lactone efflux protein [Roseiarcus fermentans]